MSANAWSTVPGGTWRARAEHRWRIRVAEILERVTYAASGYQVGACGVVVAERLWESRQVGDEALLILEHPRRSLPDVIPECPSGTVIGCPGGDVGEAGCDVDSQE